MNDNDIDLITSLIGGELPESEAAAAIARIGSDPELRAAHDEQVGVASMLGSAPVVAMTAEETASLHGSLRTELQLDDQPAAVAAAASGWSRWWAPMTGLAVAAVVIFAIAVLPDALDGTDSAEVVSAPPPETTAPASELDTQSTGGALVQPEDDNTSDAFTTTTAASESAAVEELEDATMSQYFMVPQAARASELELPILEETAVAASGFDSALGLATESARVNVAALTACFPGGAAGSALDPIGVTPDLSVVYAIATDIETGFETSVTIDMSSCEIAEAG